MTTTTATLLLSCWLLTFGIPAAVPNIVPASSAQTDTTSAGWQRFTSEDTDAVSLFPVSESDVTAMTLSTSASSVSSVVTTDQTTAMGPQTTEEPVFNGTTVVSACGFNLTLPRSRPSVTSGTLGLEITLVLSLESSVLGRNVSCSWFLHPPSHPSATHVFTFRSTSTPESCRHQFPNDQTVVCRPQDFHTFISLADSCNGDGFQASGLQGEGLNIKFYSSNVTETSLTLGRYSVFTWTPDVCGNGSTPLIASQKEAAVIFPSKDLRVIPPFIECSWAVAAPDPQGEVAFTALSIPDPVFTGRSCSLSTGLLQVVEEDSLAPQTIQQSFCEKPVNISFSTHGRILYISVLTTFLLGPGFSFTYKALPLWVVCPPSPLQMEAPADTDRYLKGVNLKGGSGSVYCLWKISAPDSGYVVKILNFYRQGYNLPQCASNDTVTFGDGKVLHMCDIQRLPWWSEGQESDVRYKPTSGSAGSYFVLQFRAVRKAQCQGYPIPHTASSAQLQQITCQGLPANDTSGNVDCRWIIQANETNMVVEARVTTNPKKSTTDCSSPVRAYDGTDVTSTYLIPNCPPDSDVNGQVIYQSHAGTMLLTYDRGSAVNGVPVEVTISYRAVNSSHPGPTGLADTLCAGNAKLILLMLTALILLSMI